ncbi:MAG TPA: 50S ribosomal protein L6 [Polyangiaceae bacterium]|jgi:large subunit ribosomal protein L6|nr:50S ribosomal protein L6 [Polyangiaceae bacterium]
MTTATHAEHEKTVLSRVGKRPIVLPKGVTVAVAAGKVDVKGPKGQLSTLLPPTVTVAQADGKVSITSSAHGREAARWQGLARALIASNVKGAAEGYERILELVGTGYRAELKGTTLHLALGLSHPVVFPLPAGVTASIPGDSKGTIIILNSASKGTLGQVAATLRSFRPPEPYAGKGVRYRGENVRRKAGKAGKK